MANQDWSDRLLDSKRSAGDALGDETVAQIFEHGEVGVVDALFAQLVREDEVPSTEGIPELARYLEESRRLPDWARTDLVEQGERVFHEWSPLALSILGCASLPETYVMRGIAAVLGTTQRLETHVRRRVLETIQMVVDVMGGGGLAPDGPGIVAAQKVRLMHAAVRHLILRRPEAGNQPQTLARQLAQLDWKSEYGVPINQEDLAVTLMTFSHVVLRGFRTFGVGLSPEQEAAYVHCWNVVGHIMGIEQALLPENPGAASFLFETIKRRQAARTEDGRSLTASLTAFMQGLDPHPAFVTQRLPRLLMRELLDAQTCDFLGVAELGLVDRVEQEALLAVVRGLDSVKRKLDHDLPPAGHFARWLGQRLMQHLIALPRGGNRSAFRIPDRLVDDRTA
jgi:hypothetical protein